MGILAARDGKTFDSVKASVPAKGTLQAVFSPWDDVEHVIVDVIDGAKQQILVQAYLLTGKKISSALIAAHRRGIEVWILADAEQDLRNSSSKISSLADAGIKVWVETKYKNAHNKIILTDVQSVDATVITGSYNFTWAAQQKNAENILIIRKNLELAAQYAANWQRHRADASPYKK
ncbi:MAG: phospholipase D family protein [Pseudomonadota bacterium]